MIYGYARVSTSQQKIERQIRNITDYCIDNSLKDFKIYEEKGISGTTIDRPCFNKLVNNVESGDTIIFDEVSRMSRNAEEGFKMYQGLYERGVNLVFLKEPHINTEVYKESMNQSLQLSGNEIADCYIEATNKVLMILARNQIKLAFEKAQGERDLLSKRTKEGMKRAENVGRPEGKPITTKKSINSKVTMLKTALTFKGAMKDTEVIELLGIRPNTYYKYKRELLQELETKTIEEVLKYLEGKEGKRNEKNINQGS